MKQEIVEMVETVARYAGLYPDDFNGITIESMLGKAERDGMTVYWGTVGDDTLAITVDLPRYDDNWN